VSCELFGDLITNFVRVIYPNDPPNWQRIKKIIEVHEKMDELAQRREKEREKEKENTTSASSTAATTDATTPVAEPKVGTEFVAEVELFVPKKCDFGETITVVADFKDFVPSGSDYIEINAEDPTSQRMSPLMTLGFNFSDFNTYQWVNGKTVSFQAPNGCGNFFFKYYCRLFRCLIPNAADTLTTTAI
jgi:hypothetical protein